MIEKHITQVNNALALLQRNIVMLLDSVLHAHAGKVQPQLVPQTVVRILTGEPGILPTEHYLAFRIERRLDKLCV